MLFAGPAVFWFAFLMLALTGAGDDPNSILRSTINQLEHARRVRGRMSSINSIFTSSGPQRSVRLNPASSPARLGAQMSALTGGLATLLVLAVVAATFPRVHRFKNPHFFS